MKRKIFSVLFALVLVLSFSLVTVVPAAAVDPAVPDRTTAITTTADRLVDLQSTTDYGWDWIVTELSAHSENPSGYNMYGVVILGLLDAYEETGTESYLNAATGMADHMTSGNASNGDFYKQGGEQESAGAYDYQFLMRYAEVSTDSTYSNYAIALWEWNKANTDIFASPSALNDALLIWGCGSADPGAASWMLAAFGTAIHAMGDDTFATGCADLIVTDLDPENGAEYLVGDHMALAECLEFLSELNPATYSSTIDQITTALVAAQQTDGCWNDGYAGTFQDTVYAVRALEVYGGTDGLNAARKGAAWLIANQLPNGGWIDDSDPNHPQSEFSEQDAEGLRALVATAAPVTIGENGYYTIQDAIDSASPDDTIDVAAGMYAGAIVDKDVTVSGAEGGASVITSGVPYKVGNPALHTAFRPDADGAEIRNFTINCNVEDDLDLGVYAVEVDDVTVDFLTINDGTIQGISNWGGSDWVITNNVITDTVALGGGGIGIFLGAKAQQQCVGNLVQYNTIDATATAETYSCAGIAVCLDTRYGGYDLLDGTEDVSGNQILDNPITASGANNGVGIEVGTILGNSEDDPDRTNPDKIATLMAATAVRDNLVQGNNIDGAETGIYFYNVTDLTITQNEIINSVDKGIYVEHGHSGVAVNYNNIYGNAYGLENDDKDVDYGSIDATNNWWGHASGPSRELTNGKWVGKKGDKVSENVDYKPWLHKSEEDVVDKKKPAYAQSVDLDNTGEYGWNTFSAPIFLDEEADTWAELYDLADELAYSLAYRFDSDNQTFVPLTTTDEYAINPGEGFFIKMDDVGSLVILYSTEENLMPPSRPLTAGWNLIGLANLEEMDVEDAFASIAEAPGLAGYSQVVSPIGNAKSGPVLADGTIYVGESYWVYMLGERTLAGFTMTPVDWVP